MRARLDHDPHWLDQTILSGAARPPSRTGSVAQHAGAHHGRRVQAAGGGSRRGHGRRLGLRVRGSGVSRLLSLGERQEGSPCTWANPILLCLPQTPRGTPPPAPPHQGSPTAAHHPLLLLGLRLRQSQGQLQLLLLLQRRLVPLGGQLGIHGLVSGAQERGTPRDPQPVPGTAGTGDWSGTRGAAPLWTRPFLPPSWRRDNTGWLSTTARPPAGPQNGDSRATGNALGKNCRVKPAVPPLGHGTPA